jgi:hypothetical protein
MEIPVNRAPLVTFGLPTYIGIAIGAAIQSPFSGRGHNTNDERLSRNSRENRTSFEGQPNISNALARRESEL